jgi:hypothetical protein
MSKDQLEGQISAIQDMIEKAKKARDGLEISHKNLHVVSMSYMKILEALPEILIEEIEERENLVEKVNKIYRENILHKIDDMVRSAEADKARDYGALSYAIFQIKQLETSLSEAQEKIKDLEDPKPNKRKALKKKPS